VLTDQDFEFDPAYAAEIQRRVAEVDAGTAELVDADEAIARARRVLEEVRKAKSLR
jgi:hypothetical protein